MEKDNPYYGWTIKKLRIEKERLKNNLISDPTRFEKIEKISTNTQK